MLSNTMKPYSRKIKELREKNGMTQAELARAIGVPDKYAMARMGHASNNMLKNVYQHIMVDKESEIDNAINQQLNTFFHNSMQHAYNTKKQKPLYINRL